MYLIVGWNQIVKALSRSFRYRGYDFKIFAPEKDIKNIEKDIVGGSEEMRNEINKIKELYESIDIDSKIILIQPDIDERIGVLKKIRKINDGCHIFCLANSNETERLGKYSIDSFIVEDELLSTAFIEKIDETESKSNSRMILEALKNSEKEIAIFLHDNPDPDAFASAMALERICEEYDKICTTYYGGSIGHPENEIIIENTQIKMENIDKDDINNIIKKSDLIIFLDFAKPGVNNILPEDIKPDIIIDHHHMNSEVNQAGYTEIRSDVGSTSTIMTEHLLNLDINISSILASTLLYGIKVDTDDFKKNIFPMDFKMINYLSAIADKELVDIFENQPMNPDTMSALGRAIVNRNFKKESLMAFAGEISAKDDIPQIANILSRERDINTVLVYGILDKNIYMSARTKSFEIHIGKKMKKAYSMLGEAGGHQHSAGGKISLSRFDDEDDAANKIEEIFKKEVIDN